MMESVDPKVRIKLWVIEHFRILPTDPRFKDLDEDQSELLFWHFINSGTDEDYRKSFHTKMSRQEMVESFPKDLVKEMGYTSEELEKITQELIAGGSLNG